jgi:GNAT superfamily N-acetyltransferase
MSSSAFLQTAMNIRLLFATDDLVELTEIIHTAYARRGAEDLRFWATHQTVEDTKARFESGQGLIAEVDGRMVGTITARPPDPDTWSLCQFAVLPQFQGAGVGRRLHDAAVDYVRTQGGRVVAFDTAAPAKKLIKMYLRWGYQQVGEVDWRPFTNYLSVVLMRPVPSKPEA